MPAPRDPRCKLRAGTRRPGGYPVTAATSARRRAVHLHAIDATSPLETPRARRRLAYHRQHESNAPHHCVGTIPEDPRDARKTVIRAPAEKLLRPALT